MAKNGISNDGPSFFNSDVTVDGPVISKANIFAIPNSDSNLLAAELINGYYTTAAGAARTVTLPTSDDIIAAIPNCQDGSSFNFTINNTSGAVVTLQKSTILPPAVLSSTTIFGSDSVAIADATVKTFIVVVSLTQNKAVVYLM